MGRSDWQWHLLPWTALLLSGPCVCSGFKCTHNCFHPPVTTGWGFLHQHSLLCCGHFSSHKVCCQYPIQPSQWPYRPSPVHCLFNLRDILLPSDSLCSELCLSEHFFLLQGALSACLSDGLVLRVLSSVPTLCHLPLLRVFFSHPTGCMAGYGDFLVLLACRNRLCPDQNLLATSLSRYYFVSLFCSFGESAALKGTPITLVWWPSQCHGVGAGCAVP